MTGHRAYDPQVLAGDRMGFPVGSSFGEMPGGMVAANKPIHHIEVVSGVHLRSNLNLKDGDRVTLEWRRVQ